MGMTALHKCTTFQPTQNIVLTHSDLYHWNIRVAINAGFFGRGVGETSSPERLEINNRDERFIKF